MTEVMDDTPIYNALVEERDSASMEHDVRVQKILDAYPSKILQEESE